MVRLEVLPPVEAWQNSKKKTPVRAARLALVRKWIGITETRQLNTVRSEIRSSLITSPDGRTCSRFIDKILNLGVGRERFDRPTPSLAVGQLYSMHKTVYWKFLTKYLRTTLVPIFENTYIQKSRERSVRLTFSTVGLCRRSRCAPKLRRRPVPNAMVRRALFEIPTTPDRTIDLFSIRSTVPAPMLCTDKK